MAKKSNFTSSKIDEGNYDDLDLPNFDMGYGNDKKIGKSRKPIAGIVRDVGKGVGKSIFDRSNIKKAVRKALPEGYGQALDFKDEAVSTAKDLYDKAAKEVKPSLKELVKATNKLVPESSRRTKSVMREIDKFFKDRDNDYGYEGADKGDPADHAVAAELGSMFKFQMKRQAKVEEEEDNKARIKDGVEAVRSRQQISLLNSINLNVSRLSQYQDKVTVAWQKKSLEVQYRSYFLLADMLKEAKATNESTKHAMDALVKNTGLPDFVKLQNTELYSQILKNKFANSITDKLFGTNSTMMRKVKDNLAKTVASYSSTISNALQQFTDMANQQVMEKELGMGTSMGEMAGGIAGQYGMEKVFDKTKGWIEKKDPNGKGRAKVRRISHQASYGVRNSMNHGKGWAEKNMHGGGAKGFLASLVMDAFRGTGTDTKLSDAKNPREPAIFNNANSRSLNEVIPGLLSRIYRELQVIRTGDDKIGLTSFSMSKGTFVNEKQTRDMISAKLGAKTKVAEVSHSAKALKEMAKKTGLGKVLAKNPERTVSTADEIIDQIDPTGKKIPSKARAELKKFMLMERIAGKLGNLDRYSNVETFGSMSDASAKAIANAFKEHGGLKGSDHHVARNNMFNTSFNALGREVEDKREAVQDLVDEGFIEHLIAMGIVDHDGEINIGKLVDLQTNGAELKSKTGRVTSRLANANAGKGLKAAAKGKKPRVKSMAAKMEKPTAAKIYRMDVPVKRSRPIGQGAQHNQFVGGQLQDVRAVGVETILERIEQLIIHKDFGAGSGLGAQGAAMGAKYAGILGQKGHELFSRAKAGAKRFGNMAESVLGGASATAVAGAQKLWGGAKAGAETAKDYIKDRYRNLYVRGEMEERLTAAKLRAGRYIDAKTGQVLTTWADIRGAVRDLDTNQIVLRAKDAKNAFMESTIVGKIVKLGQELAPKMLNAARTAQSVGSMVLTTGKELAKGAFDKLMDKIDGPDDVYIKGEDEPTLKKDDMAAGKYIDVNTKKIITKPMDITGPVRMGRRYLITTADFNTGLVDKNGQPLRSLTGRIGHGIAGAAMKLYSKGKNLVKGAYTAFTRILGGAGGVIAGVLEGVGNAFGLNTWGVRNTQVLENIYALLDQRIPKPKNMREGSWQKDMYQDDDFAGKKKKETAAKDAAKQPGSKEHKNVIDQGLEKLKSIKDTVMNIFGEGAEDAADGRKRRGKGGKGGKGPKGGGFKAGAGGMAKGAAKGAMNGAASGLASMARGGVGIAANLGKFALGGIASAGMGMLAGYGASKVAGALGASDDTADLIGTGVSIGTGIFGMSAMAGGVSAMLGVAGSIIGTALAGIGAVLSAPVVLGALAVAAVGYGAYKLYKHITKPTPLQLYRAAQYGFIEKMEDEISAVIEMENMLQPSVKFDDGGKATLDEKKIDIEKLCKMFGFSPDDNKAKNSWLYWMQKRFKPVFLTHQTALNNTKPGTTLDGVEKLPAADRMKYLAQTVMSSSSYSEFTSPFPKLAHLFAGPKAVSTTYDIVKKHWEEDLAKESKKDGDTDKTGKKDALGQTAAEKAAKESAGQKVINTFVDVMKGAGNLGMMAWNLLPPVYAAKKAIAALTWLGEKIDKSFGGAVLALEGVRFRAYGLKDMERLKVMAMRDLETEMSRGLVIDAGGQVQWIGDAAVIYDKIGGQFGIGSNKDSMELFGNWLTKRFLPVYTKYRGELYRFTNKVKQADAEQSLKAEDAIAVAQAVAGVAVWSVPYSPWRDYALNTDSASVQPNIEFLKGKAKDSKIAEQKKLGSTSTKSVAANTAKPPVDKDKEGLAKAYSKANATPSTEADREGGSLGRGSGGGGSTITSTGSAANLKSAGGEMRDGAGATQYLQVRDADLENINPEMRKLFFGMVQEYGERTGKKVGVNSGARSYAQQAAEYKKDPTKAAPPGGSMHEFGLAIDVDSATLNEMEKLGLMRKYGFTRPVGKEPWHMEPAGIQTDYMGLRKDASKASAAIVAGVGKGGGGWGISDQAQYHNRNPNMARSILEKVTDPADNTDQSAQKGPSSPTPGGAAALTPAAPVSGNPNTVAQSSAGASGSASATVSSGAGGGSLGAGAGPGAAGGGSSSSMAAPTSNNGTVGGAATSDNTPTATPGAAGAYAKIADPKGAKGWAAMKDMIVGAAKAIGIPVNTLLGLIGVESGFDPNARAGSSSAAGLGQFLTGTWQEMMGKHATRLGVPTSATQFDAKASALMAAQYIKDNGGTNDTATRAYMKHFLGPGGAKKFFAARPEATGVSILPDAAKANPGIFFDNGRPRSVAQIYALLQSRLNDKLTRNGADASMLDHSSFAANDRNSAAATGGGDAPAGDVTAGASGPTIGGAASTPQPAAPKGRSNELASYDTSGADDHQGFKAPSAPVTSSPGPSNSVMGTGANQAGQPQQNPQGDLVKTMTSVESILTASLDVQKQLLAVLQNAVNGKTGAGGAGADGGAGSSASGRAGAPTPTVPVPMTRGKVTV